MNKTQELEKQAADLREKADEITRKAEELEKAIQELNSDEPWKPKDEDFYWYIGNDGQLYEDQWCGARCELTLLEADNVFRTEEEAEASVIYAAFHGQACLKLDRVVVSQELYSLSDETDGDFSIDQVVDRLADMGFVKQKEGV